MKPLTQLFNPIPRKSGIQQRRENIEDLFKTSIYRRPVIVKIYDKVHRVTKRTQKEIDKCHSEAKSRTRQLLNMLS